MRILLPAVLAVVLIAGGPAMADPLGDFDGDLDIDTDDIDLIGDAIRLDWTDPIYDISADGETEGQDGIIDILDQDFLVFFLVETAVGEGSVYGDFNLDGLVDTTDLTRLATSYWPGEWGWADGNANRHIDLVIDTTDLTILAYWYGWPDPVWFPRPPGPWFDTVPEPASAGLLLLGASAVLRRRRKGRK